VTPPSTGAVGARRRARECALQVLYSLDVNPTVGVEQALAYFWRGLQNGEDGVEPVEREVVDFAERLARGAAAHLDELDGIIQKASKNWRLERMARVDRNLLRLGAYELHFAEDVPARVVINEAIELAKRFGTAESPAFVNGLLDRISSEVGEARKPG